MWRAVVSHWHAFVRRFQYLHVSLHIYFSLCNTYKQAFHCRSCSLKLRLSTYSKMHSQTTRLVNGRQWGRPTYPLFCLPLPLLLLLHLPLLHRLGENILRLIFGAWDNTQENSNNCGTCSKLWPKLPFLLIVDTFSSSWKDPHEVLVRCFHNIL